MEILTSLFAFNVLLTLVLVLVAIRWARGAGARILILALFALLLPAAFIGPASLLGRAKPVSWEWFRAEVKEAEVLGAKIIEGEGIYLTLIWGRTPYLYRLAWDRRKALQLQDAMRQGKANGSRVMMRRPFEPTLDERKPLFHATPQVALPPKQSPGVGVRYRHPGAGG